MTTEYPYSGITDIFTVEQDVCSLLVELWGGSGGEGSTALPGYCSADISVTPGQTFFIRVGQDGNVSAGGASPDGFLTGGNPGISNNTATGGGAGSGIYDSANNLIIAAGGAGGISGGTGSANGGSGGFPDGQDGFNSASGKGATTLIVGAGGTGSPGFDGFPGVGSKGGNGLVGSGPTGGGGGGFFGGGGGGINSPDNGAGGGGSSWYNNLMSNPVTNFFTTQVSQRPTNGNGFIRITQVACVCVAEDTKLTTPTGAQTIQSLRPGQSVWNGSAWTVIKNVAKLRSTPRQLTYCEPNSFNNNSPNTAGLLISDSHPMLINGIEVTGQQLATCPGVRMVDNQRPVYTIITESRDYVEMNGVLVATWSSDAWDNFVNNDSHGKICLYTFQ